MKDDIKEELREAAREVCRQLEREQERITEEAERLKGDRTTTLAMAGGEGA